MARKIGQTIAQDNPRYLIKFIQGGFAKRFWNLAGYRVEIVTSGYAAIKTLQATVLPKKAATLPLRHPIAVLLEYAQQGIDAEAIACQIHRRFPGIPIVLLSAYFEMPERILWLVDAYVMKSELPEGLVRVIEKVTRPANTEAVRASQCQKRKKQTKNSLPPVFNNHRFCGKCGG